MALHFDPIQATRELEAEGFDHRQAMAIVNLIRDRVLGPAEAVQEVDADAAVAAITQTGRHLEAKIDGVELRLSGRIDDVRTEVSAVRSEVSGIRAEVARLDAKIDGAVKELRHEMQIISRDAAKEAAQEVTGRIGLWLGLATGFLGLMIAASALLPAIVALFK